MGAVCPHECGCDCCKRRGAVRAAGACSKPHGACKVTYGQCLRVKRGRRGKEGSRGGKESKHQTD
jgi:hypothetical protein